MEKKRIGRPPKVNVEDLINDAENYIATANPPILAEYAHMHGITRQYLYELAGKNKILSDTIKKISEAKEIKLEKGALSGEYSANMAIFSLKQLGWSDKQKIEVSDNIDDSIKEMEAYFAEQKSNTRSTVE